MKKRTVNFVLAIVFAALCVLPAAGCSGASAKKTIVLAMPMGTEKPVWEALAADYMSVRSDVSVVVKDRDAAEYSKWLINNFATGQEVEADIITVNEIASYIADGKVLKLNPYLNRINPYMTNEETGEKERWRDGMHEDAYFSAAANKFLTLDNGTYCICPDRVQVAIFYNKKIFAQCGITEDKLPRTWDEFIALCETIAGYKNPDTNENYVPISIPGDTRALGYYFNWLMRIYSDQYFRDTEPAIAYREGDYYYDEERDGEWQFDINDILNDKTRYVGFNTVRLAAEVNGGGEISALSEKYRELLTNLKMLLPRYGLPGFSSSSMGEEYYYFYNAASAMILDASWFMTDFPEKMKRSYQTGFKQFDYGILYLPPMGMEVASDGSLVKKSGSTVGATYTRSLGGAVGYYGAVRKDKEQNDLNADFLMYFASPRGQRVRLAAMRQKGLAPKGENLIYNVEMDEDWKEALSQIEYRGECDYNPATAFAAGWMGDGESERTFYSQVQQYLIGDVDLDTAVNEIHKGLQKGITQWISTNNFKSDCLTYPERNPNI